MRKRFTRVQLGEGLKEDQTDWKRIDALTDRDVKRAIERDPDTFEVDPAWLDNATLVQPAPRKERITASFDADMLEWFRQQGRGYQTRMNAVLRAYYKAHRNNQQDQ